MHSFRAAAVLLLATALLLAGCSGGGNPPPAGTPVKMKLFKFDPENLTVAKGTTVVWTNEDSSAHTVTGESGGPNSGNIAKGGSYTFKFDTPGTFAYYCKVPGHAQAKEGGGHTGMVGSVTVTA